MAEAVAAVFAPEAPLFVMAGPCALESRQMAVDVAGTMAELCGRLGLPYVFKGSFDKANRTSGRGGRGPGLAEGVACLAEVKRVVGVPVMTDVHLPEQAAEVAAEVDVLQIPAFLCRQTDLLRACAKTGRAMNIKKGQFVAPADMAHVAEKARAAGCRRVALCERGSCFGYHDLVVDMRALVWMRKMGCPVVFDATHSAQLPGGGGGRSGGLREMVAPLARAAVAVGVNGVFVETHPRPEAAISDAETQVALADMPALLESLAAVHAAGGRR